MLVINPLVDDRELFKPIFGLSDKIGLLILLKNGLRIIPFDPFSLIDFEAIKGMKKSQKP